MDLLKRIVFALALAIVAGAIGYVWGRQDAPEPEVRYVTKNSVSGGLDLSNLAPIEAISPPKSSLKWVYIPPEEKAQNEGVLGPKTPGDSLQIDTLGSVRATIEDWNTRRTYSRTLFSDVENGTLDLSFSVQYNRPQQFDWSYTPPATPVVIPKPKKTTLWGPYLRASVNTLGGVGVGAGVFINHVGVDVSYLHDFRGQSSGIGIGVIYKF